MTHQPFGDRLRRRLGRELDSLAPLIGEARTHPVTRHVRQTATSARVGLKASLGDADRLLDRIVARALDPPQPAGSDGPSTPGSGGRAVTSIAVVVPRPVHCTPESVDRWWGAVVRALQAAGHAVDLVAIDRAESTFLEVLTSYRRFAELDLSAYDAAVSGVYPSWMVHHPHHVRLFHHPLRALYDRYPPDLPQPTAGQHAEVRRRRHNPPALIEWAADRAAHDPSEWGLPSPWARAVVHALDADASGRIAGQAVVSETVALRPSYRGGLLPDDAALAVVTPPTDPIAGPGAEPGAHFLAYGPLVPEQRFDLTIEAFARSGVGRTQPEPFELWIGGTGPEEARLRALAARTTGVHLIGRAADVELTTYLASSIAVVATPRDEDYGQVAADAHAAGRPVLTVSDSGGIAEQVSSAGRGGTTGGIITAPHPRMLGKAIRDLALDPPRADRLGRAGLDRVEQLSWAPLVRLVEKTADPSSGHRPKLLMLSTFLADPITGGGSRRLRAVASGLQQGFDVTVLALTSQVTDVRRRLLADGVVQLAVGRSARHRRADREMRALAGVAVDDIAASVLFAATPTFAPLLRDELSDAAAAVLARPFLATALPPGLTCPVVYDAHSVEIDLQVRLLRGRPGARRLMEWCEHAEATALVRAGLVSAPSPEQLARLCPPGCGHRNLVAPDGVDERLLACPPGPGPQRSAARSRLLADLGLDADRRPIVLFIGSSDTADHDTADHDTADHDTADRLAELARETPDLLFVLAGGHSEQRRRGPSSLGSFADHDRLRLMLAADAIVNPVVAPSRNLELLEALASGTPVVATATGARGLRQPERVLTVAEPPGLLVGIRSVLDRPGPARERAGAGQELARRHRWSEVLAPLETAIADLVGVRLAP